MTRKLAVRAIFAICVLVPAAAISASILRAAPQSAKFSLSISFDEKDAQPARLVHQTQGLFFVAKAKSLSMTQADGRVTVQMQDGTFEQRNGGRDVPQTQNFSRLSVFFDANGELLNYRVSPK